MQPTKPNKVQNYCLLIYKSTIFATSLSKNKGQYYCLMMKRTSFVASLLLGTSYPSATAAIERVIFSGQSIAATIQDAHASGDFRPHFTLNAERADINRTNYMVRVREAVPAVTSMTTTSIENGTSIPVSEIDVATMLVSDKDGVIALIYLDKKGGKVNGIVQKNGENIKFMQRTSLDDGLAHREPERWLPILRPQGHKRWLEY